MNDDQIIQLYFDRSEQAIKETERSVFLCRYWYLDSTEEIAEKSGFSVSKVKTMLFRIRKRLHTQLEKEGLL